MALDTLEVFGTEYTGVAGFKATDDNDQIKTYIRPQGTLYITQNGTGINCSQYEAVDVTVSASNTFTLEYQVDLTQDDPFTFDSTFAEIKAAVQAGKVFEYTSYDDPVIGGFVGSCYITNQTFQGHYYTEAVRFYLDGTDSKTYMVWYGYVGGVITEDYKVYQMEVPTDTLTADDSGDWNVVEVATLTIPAGTAGTPTATKGTVSNHAINVTPSVTNQSGWINGGTKTGTAVTVSASELVSGTYNVTSSGTKDVTNYAAASVPSGTVTAPSTITGTSATVSTGTNTLTLTKTVSVTPSVTTAGYVSSGTAGNSSVSLTASVTTQAAQTIHPSTSDQTIASGRYLTGAQTIKAVTTTNLSASNILSGVTVKVGDSTDDDCVASVAGSVTFQTYYTGSSAPSSSLGVNGDIYLQTS